MNSISKCQDAHSISLQGILKAAGHALWKAGVQVVYALADAIDIILSSIGVALSGVVALAKIFLAGVKLVVELVASAVGGIESSINSVINVFGGICKESGDIKKALQWASLGLKALHNKLTDAANQIGRWMDSMDALQEQLASGTNWARNGIQPHIHYP